MCVDSCRLWFDSRRSPSAFEAHCVECSPLSPSPKKEASNNLSPPEVIFSLMNNAVDFRFSARVQLQGMKGTLSRLKPLDHEAPFFFVVAGVWWLQY